LNISAIWVAVKLGEGGGMKPASRKNPTNHVTAQAGPAQAQRR
jgi:hypothetical protein